MNPNTYTIPKNEIQLWWFNLDQTKGIVDEYYSLLNQGEKKIIRKFKTRSLRDRFTVSRGVLKSLISNYLHIDPAEVEFALNSHGKPLLSPKQNKINLKFNISHSNKRGIYAFTKDKNVGVDIEAIQEYADLEDVAELCMSDYEKCWFFKLPKAARCSTFYKVWTVKEAFVKAIGAGLYFPLKNVEVKIDKNYEPDFHAIRGISDFSRKWNIFPFNTVPNYAASLVTEGGDSKIRNFYLEPSNSNG